MWSGRVVLITGASRGIGAAFAKQIARLGAKVVLTGRSVDAPSHQRLSGTLRELADEIRSDGNTAEVHKLDVSRAADITAVVDAVVKRHSRLDVVVNNASAVDVSQQPSLKLAQLMLDVNSRGTLLTNLATLEHLKQSHGQIVTLSPPLNEDLQHWLSAAPSYAVSKYGMTMATLGFSKEIKTNCLWPKRTVATAATAMLEERLGTPYHSAGRHPDYFAKAMISLLENDTLNGKALLDEDILSYNAPDSNDAPLDMFVRP